MIERRTSKREKGKEAMDGYEIEKIDEGLWAIDDKMGCSMYFVEVKNKALLVDTGVQ